MGALHGLLRLPLRYVNSPARLLTFGEKAFKLSGFRTPARDAAQPRRVVIIKLDRLGDVTLSGALLDRLRRAWPSTHITLIVRESLTGLARCHRAVDDVIGVPDSEGTMTYDPRTGQYPSWSAQVRGWLAVCEEKQLWQQKFDVAIVGRWDTDFYGATALAYLTGARIRWGVCDAASSVKARLNCGFETLLTDVVHGTCTAHEHLLNESLAAAISGAPREPLFRLGLTTVSSAAYARKVLTDAGVDLTKPVIAVGMGATEAFRMWPAARYAALFREVFDLSTTQLVTFGRAEQIHLGLELRDALGDCVANLEGKLEMAALPPALALCSLYIGSDAGPMHLACAADVPVLEICCHPADGDPYSPQSPIRFGPWGTLSEVVQPEHATWPCTTTCRANASHCILEVSVTRAAQALRALLHKTGLPGAAGEAAVSAR